MRTLLILLVALASWADAPGAAARPPNVLFIVSDDLNTRLHCYGDPMVKCPNVDRLAARGVRFERAYCQFPLCNPSRSSFMTGLRPDTTKVYQNRTHLREAVPDAQTLPQTFQQAGYFVARVGKIFHYGVPFQIGTDGLDDPPSWQQRVNPKGREKDEEAGVINLTPALTNIGGALTWYRTGGDGRDHTDGKIADEVIRLLELNKEKPLFIACGFFRPHVPCVASDNFFDLYQPEKIKLPVEPDHLGNVPPIAMVVKPPHYGIAENEQRQMIRAYFASISLMDAQLGRVLDALDRLGLVDNTIITFCGDHGWLLGEHGQWQKMSLFEQSARVPLIIAAPKAKGNGKASPRTVELVDLHATLADLCGLKPPPNLEGTSLRPLLENPSAKWDKPAYTQVTRGVAVGTLDQDVKGQRAVMGRSVRTERWRYTEWDEGRQGVELYDHDHDPQEYRNLANDPKYSSQMAGLKKLLHR